MNSPPLYLDNNATTPLDPAVLDAMLPYLRDLTGNPSSRHRLGRASRRGIDLAKQQIAAALDADLDQVFFTSGATEANNLAISNCGPTGSPLLLNPTEHPSALEPVLALEKLGHPVTRFLIDEQGLIVQAPHTIAESGVSDERPGLAVVQLANSETGTLQNVGELRSQLPSSWRFHCDAVQAIGKVAVSFRELGVSSLSLSGHKIHGPAGIGTLLLRQDFNWKGILRGGAQQSEIRPGTESVASIVGLGVAVELAEKGRGEHAERMRKLRDKFERELFAALPGLSQNGSPEHRLPNTSNISLPGTSAEQLLIMLDLAGVCCSAGTACASGSLEPSPVLMAMGIEGERLHCALRFSISRMTDETAIERGAAAVIRAVNQQRN